MKKIVLGKPFENTKYSFRETCFGICVNNNKILLSYNSSKNEYALPGGGIEKGESKTDCLAREFKEETGYGIKDYCEFVSIDCFWLAANVYPMESLAHFYLVNVDKKEFLTEKFSEGVWVNLFEAKNFLPLPYQAKALEFYLENLN